MQSGIVWSRVDTTLSGVGRQAVSVGADDLPVETALVVLHNRVQLAGSLAAVHLVLAAVVNVPDDGGC